MANLLKMPGKKAGKRPGERFYRELFDNLPAAVYTTDASGRITCFNKAAVHFWGRAPQPGEEWCGSYRIYAPDGTPVPHNECPMAVSLREKRPVRGVEAVAERPDGTRVPFLPFPTPLHNVSGEMIGAVNMLVDITERRQSEAAIERRNKWLKLLSETAADLVSATDPQAMMQAIFQKVSRHIECDIFLNYTVAGEGPAAYLALEAWGGIDEAVCREFARLEFGEAVCGTTAQTRQVIAIDRVQESSDPRIHKLRSLGVRAYICQPLVAGGRLLGTLSYASRAKDSFGAEEKEIIVTMGHYVALAKMRMLTEQAARDAEDRLRRALEETARQANAASVAKSEFLANLSHEIRTPMNAIVGLTHLLDRTEMDAEKRKNALRIMKVSAQQLMELINNVLDISKIESGQLEFEQAPFDLWSLFGEIVSIHNVKAMEKGITLNLRYLTEPQVQVTGDSLRLKQVLMNLVGNAVKFTEKGEVNICVDCPLAGDGQTVLLHVDVQDTGIGIQKEYLAHIFTKFSQGDASMTRRYGGTGLGLVITRKLVEAMDGTVAVTSTAGRGSCFSISIPLPIRQDEKVIYPNFGTGSEKQGLKGCHVLLVEDYAANIMVATTLLDEFGCTYKVANNGEEAFSLLKQEAFDAVLMDVQMPVMDGFKTTALIRAWEKESGRPHTIIIGITAHALAGDYERCLQAGMDDYLSKPFQPHELEARMSKYASKSGKVCLEA